MVGGGSIPSSDRKTIELIREITRKQHTDDEIHAVLKECHMDPNETAQKLMFLDTFHEVKKKRDKRKESVQNRPQDSGPASGAQRRGARSGRGNYSSFHAPAGRHDVGRRNANGRRENGISESKERGSVPSLSQLSERTAKVSTVLANGHGSLPNGNSSQAHVGVNSEKVGSDSYLHAASVKSPSISSPTSTSTSSSVIKMRPGKSALKSECPQAPGSPASASGLNSASDPVLVPSLKPLQPGAVGTFKREVGTQHVPCEGDLESDTVKLGSVSENFVHETSQKMEAVERDHTSKESQSLDSLVISTDGAIIDDNHSSQELPVPSKALTAEASSQASPESNVSSGHHVTFPNNFQVPEAFRNGLTFGSLKVSFGAGVMHVSDSLCGDSKSADPESPQKNQETTQETSSRPSSSSDDLAAEDADQLVSPQQRPEEVLHSEVNVPSGAIKENDQPKQDHLIPSEGSQGFQHSALHGAAPNGTLGLAPSMTGNQIVQLDNTKSPAQDVSAILNYTSGNPPLQATSTPPLTQPGMMQSSVPMSPQPLLPFFRQPYPPNYFPYGHYIPMMMPPMQQFLSPNGLPQQGSTGNLYIPPHSPSAGIKYPVPPFKPGANVSNPTPFGIPSAYGSYSPSPMGYSLGPTVTTRSSAINEDFAASQLKGNHGYTTAQLNDGSATWIPQAGQDMAGLAVNSSYSMLPQSRHATYSHPQALHGPHAGILQPPHTIPAPSVHTLLQQSQAMAGAIESARPQSGIYQQAQPAQTWNSNY